MSECWGWLQLDSKFFQVVKTWAPLAVCLPSAVVMTHCFAATTQWPAVSTVLELTRVPVHDAMGLPDPSRSSMNTLAGFPDDRHRDLLGVRRAAARHEATDGDHCSEHSDVEPHDCS